MPRQAILSAILGTLAACLVVFLARPPGTSSVPGSGASRDASKPQVRIRTKYGDMVVRLLPELAPRTVQNFCDLARKRFYDGITFHRVVRGFMIQGGDPTGTGGGGPGYTIKAEFSSHPHRRGTVSMARARHPDSAGSQFFIVHGESAPHLDGNYTVFGELVSGFDVLDRIATAPVLPGSDRPVDPVHMESVTVEDGK